MKAMLLNFNRQQGRFRRWGSVGVALVVCCGLQAGSLIGQNVSPAPHEQIRRQQAIQALIGQLEIRRSDLQANLSELAEREKASREEIEEVVARQRQFSVAPASLDDVTRLLQTRRIDLTIDLAGLDARKTAILEAMELADRDDGAVNDDDPLRSKLQELVNIARKRLQVTQQLANRGHASSTSPLEVQKELLAAEIQLLSLGDRQSAAKDALHMKLTDVLLERAETVARLERVEKLLPEVDAARDANDQAIRSRETLEQLNLERLATMRELEQTTDRLLDVKGYLDSWRSRDRRDDQDNY